MSEFVGRDLLVKGLWERLRAPGTHLVLLGPRRVGKSSMLDHMQANPMRARLIRIDLQGATSVEDLLTRLHESLESIGSRVVRELGRIQSVQVVGSGVAVSHAPDRPWLSIRELLRNAESPGEGPLIIALDEAPWWLDAVERRELHGARTALAELRRLRGDVRLGSIRWLFTGSVGIGSRLGRWGADAEFNDVTFVPVPPLDEPSGMTVFEMVCAERGVAMERAAAKHAWNLAGGRPHWIRVLAERSAAAYTAVGIDEVNAEAAHLVSTPQRGLFRDEGEQHFAREYSNAEREVRTAVFDCFSAAPEGARLPRLGLVAAGQSQGQPPSLVREVVARLVEDFYLRESEDGSLLWISVPLFGRWWKRWGAL